MKKNHRKEKVNNCYKSFKKKLKNIKNQEEVQEIHIEQSRFMDSIEKVGLLLHIIALTLGILTLIGAISSLNEEFEWWLEIFTVIVVFLIVIWHFLMPFLKIIWVRLILNQFWGQSIIRERVGRFENIENIKNPNQNERLSVGTHKRDQILIMKWKRVNFSQLKLTIKIQIPKDINLKLSKQNILNKSYKDSDFIEINYNIESVFVNFKEESIKIYSYVESEEFDFPRQILVMIYPTRGVAYWSGILPDNPFHGEWMLDQIEKIKWYDWYLEDYLDF